VKLDPAQWREASDLLDQALDMHEERRQAWLDALDNVDPVVKTVLRDALEANAEGRTRDFVDALPRLTNEVTNGRHTRDVVGAYRLLRRLGAGGMGEVWLAERADGMLERRVALKLPVLALSRAALSERFARERALLAPLAHEHIARLYDACFADDGQPFLALEYVEGERIDRYAETRRLDVEARLRLFEQVLEAVSHAHANLVLHRDLKPSNILVTAEGSVKLLDFGIAKLMDDGEARETELTRLAGAALTLDYASPEQIAGRSLTTATDVYSLGVVLYELLTGERAYMLKRGTRGELEEAIARIDPVLPSQARIRDETAAAMGTTPSRLRARLVGDLDTIVTKALRKDAAARYATIEAFAEDLRRHRERLPVLARPDSRWYRTRRFVQRHALSVAAGTTVAVALAVATSVSLVMLERANSAAAEARRKADVARSVQSFVVDVFGANDVDIDAVEHSRDMTASQLLDRGASKIDRSLGEAPEVRAELLRLFGELYAQLGQNQKALALHERSVSEARRLHGETSREYAIALMLRAVSAWPIVAETWPRTDIERARDILARVAPDSEDYAIALELHADYILSIDGAEAAREMETAIRILARPGVAPLRTAYAKARLGRAYVQIGALEPAERTLDDARRALETLFGAAHPMAISMRIELAAVYRLECRLAEAEAELRAAISAGEAKPGGRGFPYARLLDAVIVTQARRGWQASLPDVAAAAQRARTETNADAMQAEHQINAYVAALAIGHGEVRDSVNTLEGLLRDRRPNAPAYLPPTVVHTQLARAYLLRGDIERAWSEIEAARDALPHAASPLMLQVVLSTAAQVRAARGEAVEAQRDLDAVRRDYPIDPLALWYRVYADLTAAHVALARRDAKAVAALLSPWLATNDLRKNVEIPLHARGEALMLWGEAVRNGDPANSRRLLEQAAATLETADAPGSAYVARVRADLAADTTRPVH